MLASDLDDPNHPDNYHCPFSQLSIPKSATEEQVLASYDKHVQIVMSDPHDIPSAEVREILKIGLSISRDNALDIIRKRKELESQKTQDEIHAEKRRKFDEILQQEREEQDKATMAQHIQEELKPMLASPSVTPAFSDFFRSELSKIALPEQEIMLQGYFPLVQRLKGELEEARKATASEKEAREHAEKQISLLTANLSDTRHELDSTKRFAEEDLGFERIRTRNAEENLEHFKKQIGIEMQAKADSIDSHIEKIELALKEASAKAAATVGDLKMSHDAEREKSLCKKDA